MRSMVLGKGDVKTAYRILRRNRGRSLLTMLGVIIGVASVVTVVSIGDGVKQQVNSATDRLGKDLITVRPGRLPAENRLPMLTNIAQLTSAGGAALNNRDLETVQRTAGVSTVAPLSVVSGDVVSGEGGKHYHDPVIGTTAAFPAMVHQTLMYGGFFDDQSMADNKVVIGRHVADVLYSEAIPLGQTLTILGHQFVVVGIFDDFQITPLSADTDFNDAVFMPYGISEQITNSSAPIYEILARPQRVTDTDRVASTLQTRLTVSHGGQADVTVLKQAQTLAVSQSILGLLTALVAGLAAISLLVGGVGIMNVMLVSVTERMHEIGIRKAVGATSGQILSQFVIEAAVLSFVGGIIGVLLSLMVDMGLRFFTGFVPVMSWQVVTLACLVSVGVGILFGSIPAMQAARKDPIAALRNE